MREVMITNTNSMCYKLVMDAQGNRYLMDVSTVSNKLYCFGVQSDKVTVDMVGIDKNDTRFEQKNLQSSTFVAITAGSQFFANIVYRSLTEFIKEQKLHQQIIFQVGLFMISILFAALLMKLFAMMSKKYVTDRVPAHPKRYVATFKTTSKRHLSFYIPLSINMILFLFYLRASIGGSVVLLVFNTILTLWILIGCFVGFPVDILYKNKEFQLESIEEVK